MKLKKIKKNIAKLPMEKQIKLANWVDKFIKDAQNNPALAGKVEQETTESI